MENMYGKIVVDKRHPNPIVIISETSKCLRGLSLIKETSDLDCKLIIPQDEVEELGYKGKKLNQHFIADYNKTITIYNPNIKIIGKISEGYYFKLLRHYNNCQVSSSNPKGDFKLIRDEIQNQLIKKMK